MYRIPQPAPAELNSYYQKYSEELKARIEEVLSGKSFLKKLGSLVVCVQLIPGSNTDKFLHFCSTNEGLEVLLCGDWNSQLDLIKKIHRDFKFDIDKWQTNITKGRLEKGEYLMDGKDAEGHIIVDHFNFLLRQIFIEGMYDSEIFDKLALIRSKDLTVCPYCGRSKVVIGEEVGERVSKPPLDHFLPKTKYPFLAVNYYNLIPCCTTCNQMDNKGDYDPLSHLPLKFRLMNPYCFYDQIVRFSYTYNGLGDYDENSFLVNSSAENSDFEEGYFKKLKIRSFYSQEQLRVSNMYQRMVNVNGQGGVFLENLGVEKKTNLLEMFVIGQPLNDEMAKKSCFYKFDKEIYEQMLKEFGIEN